MTHKYFKTISELIDDYVCIFDFSPANDEELYGDMLTQALIHAYELGYKHATEEEQPNPAEFDSNYEKETSNE